MNGGTFTPVSKASFLSFSDRLYDRDNLRAAPKYLGFLATQGMKILVMLESRPSRTLRMSPVGRRPLTVCVRAVTILIHVSNVWYMSNVDTFAYKLFGVRQTSNTKRLSSIVCPNELTESNSYQHRGDTNEERTSNI